MHRHGYGTAGSGQKIEGIGRCGFRQSIVSLHFVFVWDMTLIIVLQACSSDGNADSIRGLKKSHKVVCSSWHGEPLNLNARWTGPSNLACNTPSVWYDGPPTPVQSHDQSQRSRPQKIMSCLTMSVTS